jgi:NAD(P)H-flavin reductase
MKPDQEFLIAGPFGKGLDFSEAAITGKNVIFLGGTGTLPFIDLFAYLGRLLLKEKKNQNIFENEEFETYFDKVSFVVYAYFPRESEGCCLELLRKISDFYLENGAEERFKFIPVFTRDGGERLSNEKIFEILDKHHQESKLRNLWVCGPPKMNNMFQRLRKRIMKQYEIGAGNIDIL